MSSTSPNPTKNTTAWHQGHQLSQNTSATPAGNRNRKDRKDMLPKVSLRPRNPRLSYLPKTFPISDDETDKENLPSDEDPLDTDPEYVPPSGWCAEKSKEEKRGVMDIEVENKPTNKIFQFDNALPLSTPSTFSSSVTVKDIGNSAISLAPDHLQTAKAAIELKASSRSDIQWASSTHPVLPDQSFSLLSPANIDNSRGCCHQKQADDFDGESEDICPQISQRRKRRRAEIGDTDDDLWIFNGVDYDESRSAEDGSDKESSTIAKTISLTPRLSESAGRARDRTKGFAIIQLKTGVDLSSKPDDTRESQKQQSVKRSKMSAVANATKDPRPSPTSIPSQPHSNKSISITQYDVPSPLAARSIKSDGSKDLNRYPAMSRSEVEVVIENLKPTQSHFKITKPRLPSTLSFISTNGHKSKGFPYAYSARPYKQSYTKATPIPSILPKSSASVNTPPAHLSWLPSFLFSNRHINKSIHNVANAAALYNVLRQQTILHGKDPQLKANYMELMRRIFEQPIADAGMWAADFDKLWKFYEERGKVKSCTEEVTGAAEILKMRQAEESRKIYEQRKQGRDGDLAPTREARTHESLLVEPALLKSSLYSQERSQSVHTQKPAEQDEVGLQERTSSEPKRNKGTPKLTKSTSSTEFDEEAVKYLKRTRYFHERKKNSGQNRSAAPEGNQPQTHAGASSFDNVDSSEDWNLLAPNTPMVLNSPGAMSNCTANRALEKNTPVTILVDEDEHVQGDSAPNTDDIVQVTPDQPMKIFPITKRSSDRIGKRKRQSRVDCKDGEAGAESSIPMLNAPKISKSDKTPVSPSMKVPCDTSTQPSTCEDSSDRAGDFQDVMHDNQIHQHVAVKSVWTTPSPPRSQSPVEETAVDVTSAKDGKAGNLSNEKDYKQTTDVYHVNKNLDHWSAAQSTTPSLPEAKHSDSALGPLDSATGQTNSSIAITEIRLPESKVGDTRISFRTAASRVGNLAVVNSNREPMNNSQRLAASSAIITNESKGSKKLFSSDASITKFSSSEAGFSSSEAEFSSSEAGYSGAVNMSETDTSIQSTAHVPPFVLVNKQARSDIYDNLEALSSASRPLIPSFQQINEEDFRPLHVSKTWQRSSDRDTWSRHNSQSDVDDDELVIVIGRKKIRLQGAIDVTLLRDEKGRPTLRVKDEECIECDSRCSSHPTSSLPNSASTTPSN